MVDSEISAASYNPIDYSVVEAFQTYKLYIVTRILYWFRCQYRKYWSPISMKRRLTFLYALLYWGTYFEHSKIYLYCKESMFLFLIPSAFKHKTKIWWNVSIMRTKALSIMTCIFRVLFNSATSDFFCETGHELNKTFLKLLYCL